MTHRTACFVDTFALLALLNPADAMHRVTRRWFDASRRPLLLTDWILVELADGLCAARTRQAFLTIERRLRGDGRVTIVPASRALLDRGLALYAARPDKDWSLTDCTSFTVMAERGLTDALTGDRHFAQAGFVPLLA